MSFESKGNYFPFFFEINFFVSKVCSTFVLSSKIKVMQNQFTLDELQVIKNAITYLRVYGMYDEQILRDAYSKVEEMQTEASKLDSEKRKAKMQAV